MSRHDHPGLFKKGQSGNPAGRPKLPREHFEFKEAMEARLPKVFEVLDEMLASGEFEQQRFAVQTVMDRTQGKAIERKELTGANGGAIQIEDSTPAIRLLLQAAIEAETKVIEVKAEGEDE